MCQGFTICLLILPPLPFPIPLQFMLFLYQVMLLGEGFPRILTRVLESCFAATDSDGMQVSDCRESAKYGFTLISFCIPVFQCLSLLCSSPTSSKYDGIHDMHKSESLSPKDCSIFINPTLEVLPGPTSWKGISVLSYRF